MLEMPTSKEKDFVLVCVEVPEGGGCPWETSHFSLEPFYDLPKRHHDDT